MSSKSPSPLLAWLARALIWGSEAEFIRADLDDSFERDVARGVSPLRAHGRYASNMFGSAASVWWSWLRSRALRVSWLDVKLGLRMLPKNPGLTGAAVFALAVGIPVGLAPMHAAKVFEVDPPFEHADRLYIVKNFNVATSNWRASSRLDVERWTAEATGFELMGASREGYHNIASDDGRAEPVRGAYVTASAFDIVGVRPTLGRTLLRADEQMGSGDVVVVGHDLWRSRLESDPDVVGRTVRIGGVPHTVVGVMPEDFHFPIRGGFWMPLRDPGSAAELSTDALYRVFGRIAEGTEPDQVQAALATIGQRMATEFPETHARLRPEVVPFSLGLYGMRGSLRAEVGFYIFQLLALLVLVVACVNVGMLVFTRTASRASELAVRTALGASRGRVIRQLFVEALVLAVVAAAVGLLVADLIAARRFEWLVEVTPTWFDFGVTRWTATWAFSLAVLSAGIIGVVPALKFTGKRVQKNLQNAGSGRSGARFGGVSSGLLMADVALAVATVAFAVGLAGAMEKSLDGAAIETQHFVSADLRVPRAEAVLGQSSIDAVERAARIGEVQRALAARLEADPAVRGVTFGSALPGMDHRSRRIALDTDVLSDEFEGPRVQIATVDLDFFETLEQPVLSGRAFRPADTEDDQQPVIVNTSFVNELLGGQNAIGRRLRFLPRPGQEQGPWYEIVGVVGALGMGGAGVEGSPGLYHPMKAGEHNPVFMAVHVGPGAEAFIPQLRTIAAEVDPTLLVSNPMVLEDVFSFDAEMTGWIELGAKILTGILLALSISGIYALMSFTVTDRTREIGIRSALGSTKSGIAMSVAKRALTQLGVGVGVGVGIALWLLLQFDEMGGGSGASPIVAALGIGVGVAVTVGALACAGPTRRALRVTPTEALKA